MAFDRKKWQKESPQIIFDDPLLIVWSSNGCFLLKSRPSHKNGLYKAGGVIKNLGLKILPLSMVDFYADRHHIIEYSNSPTLQRHL